MENAIIYVCDFLLNDENDDVGTMGREIVRGMCVGLNVNNNH